MCRSPPGAGCDQRRVRPGPADAAVTARAVRDPAELQQGAVRRDDQPVDVVAADVQEVDEYARGIPEPAADRGLPRGSAAGRTVEAGVAGEELPVLGELRPGLVGDGDRAVVRQPWRLLHGRDAPLVAGAHAVAPVLTPHQRRAGALLPTARRRHHARPHLRRSCVARPPLPLAAVPGRGVGLDRIGAVGQHEAGDAQVALAGTVDDYLGSMRAGAVADADVEALDHGALRCHRPRTGFSPRRRCRAGRG